MNVANYVAFGAAIAMLPAFFVPLLEIGQIGATNHEGGIAIVMILGLASVVGPGIGAVLGFLVGLFLTLSKSRPTRQANVEKEISRATNDPPDVRG